MSSISNELMHFVYKHKEKMGMPYMVNYAKDASIMKNIVSTFGTIDTIRLVDAFFDSIETDDFIKKAGASVGVLKVKIPQLLLIIREEKVDMSKGKL